MVWCKTLEVSSTKDFQKMFEEYVQPIVDFVRLHQAWAAPVVFALW